MSKLDKGTDMESVETSDGKKYAKFTHTWNDLWDETEVSITGRFSRPTKEQLKRMQNKAVKDSQGATQNLLMDIVHPDDREQLLADLAKYPGLVTTFGAAVIKAVGISADLGN